MGVVVQAREQEFYDWADANGGASPGEAWNAAWERRQTEIHALLVSFAHANREWGHKLAQLEVAVERDRLRADRAENALGTALRRAAAAEEERDQAIQKLSTASYEVTQVREQGRRLRAELAATRTEAQTVEWVGSESAMGTHEGPSSARPDLHGSPMPAAPQGEHAP